MFQIYLPTFSWYLLHVVKSRGFSICETKTCWILSGRSFKKEGLFLVAHKTVKPSSNLYLTISNFNLVSGEKESMLLDPNSWKFLLLLLLLLGLYSNAWTVVTLIFVLGISLVIYALFNLKLYFIFIISKFSFPYVVMDIQLRFWKDLSKMQVMWTME